MKIIVALIGFFWVMQVTAKDRVRSVEYRISKGYQNASDHNLSAYCNIFQQNVPHQVKYTLPEDDNDDMQIVNERDDDDTENKNIVSNRALKLFSLFHELAGTAPFLTRHQPSFAFLNTHNQNLGSGLELYLQLLIIKI